MSNSSQPAQVGENGGSGHVVEAVTVRAPQTVDVFVLMVRYGNDYWAAHSTHCDLGAAARQADSLSAKDGQTVWRIVSVRGLPVHAAPGEAA